MTNPTPLSPAAQAVLDAAEAGLDGYIELLPPTWKSSVAAALRATSKHCVPDDSEGHWVYIPHVLAIAAELEALPND